MSITSESDEKMMPKNDIGSPAVDDANSGGSMGGNSQLKKGPWTSAEDAILVEYVTKHGEGNWNAVQKHSGLARCGKSCRLRWANHLRPNLKKGAFSPEEEQLIIELHAKMGNKWARMAAELPGRTDNEIKNYWNTRIKRRQRAGLPIYPPDICSQSLNENQQSDNMNDFSSRDAHYPDFTPANIYEFRAIEFKNLEFNQQFYQTVLLDIPASQGFHSYPNRALLSTMHPPKRLRASEAFFPGLTGNAIIPGGSRHQNGTTVQIAQSLMYSSSAYDHNSTPNHASPSSLFPGSHAVINGNPSSSEPARAMKLELPSLQTQVGSWGSPSSPLTSLESVDTFIQTLPTQHTLPCNLLPRNSGLLDAVLYESQTMRNSENGSHQKTSYASDMVFSIKDTSPHQDLNGTEWGAYEHQTASPLCHSSSSMFSEGTPISANSFDELESLETIQGCKVKESTTLVPIQYSDRVETTNEMVFTRPDLMLAADQYSLHNDAIGRLFSDDLSKDRLQENGHIYFSTSRPCA